MPARMNREKTLRTLGSSFLITLKQPAISLQNLGCHTDWRLRVFDRFDQAPSAIEFFRGAQGGIAEREPSMPMSMKSWRILEACTGVAGCNMTRRSGGIRSITV